VAALGVVLAVLMGSLVTSTSPVAASDDPSYSLLATVTGLSWPWGVAVSPDGSRVYVANGVRFGTVSVIDRSSDTVSATVSVGNTPYGVVVSPDGSRVYVANNGDGTVSVIDTSSNTVTETVSGLSNPAGVAVSPDGSRLYVGNTGNGTVSVINTSSNTVTATVSVGIGPYALQVSPDGSRVYVGNASSSSVSVINTSSNTVTATVSVGSGPYGVAVSPDGSRVYVANFLSGSVSVIDTSLNTVTATISVGTYPWGIAVSPDGSRVYVSDVGDNKLRVVDLSSNTVTATVSGFDTPYALAVSPDGSRVYVANDIALGTVSVIESGPSVAAPEAPTSLSATSGDGSATITFTSGADGGAAITKYQAKVGTGAWTDVVGTSSPLTVTGLTNYARVTVKLRAVNSAGAGAESAGVSVWPRATGPLLTSVKAVGTMRIRASFAALTPVGGTVSRYWVYAYVKGTNTLAGSCRSTAVARSCVVAGLTANTEYDVVVRGFFTLTGSPTVLPTLDSTRQTVRTRS
jgi:YVTN family beta-propeller protein